MKHDDFRDEEHLAIRAIPDRDKQAISDGTRNSACAAASFLVLGFFSTLALSRGRKQEDEHGPGDELAVRLGGARLRSEQKQTERPPSKEVVVDEDLKSRRLSRALASGASHANSVNTLSAD